MSGNGSHPINDRAEIAVIDYECMTSVGSNLSDSWQNLISNRSGIRTIDRYQPKQISLHGVEKIGYGGQIPLPFWQLAGSEERLRKWREPSFHAVQSLTRAVLKKINFDISQHDPQRIGFLGGAAWPPQAARDFAGESGEVDSKFILNQCVNLPLSAAASEFNIQGPSLFIGAACASSGNAILIAAQMLRADLLDFALVVGFDFPVTPLIICGFDRINALYRWDTPGDRGYDDPTKASRPFSIDRRGLLMSEGAGIIVLARPGYARQMAWPVKGIIRGGYANSDADHLTRNSIDNVSHCIRGAIKAAGCRPEDIDCINAHATSTPIGDANELKALAQVFGNRLKQTPVVANKSQIGHTMGAAAILALILALEGMNQGVLLPTLNYLPDPELPEALISSRAIERPHRRTIISASGFGGTNVSLVAERQPDW
jgi:3-oxoacyl-[acyl-carrier-protein] synthase II